MSAQKFEKLIDLIINEDEQQARELFHDIVVEKSREIYESIMDEEMSMEADMSEVDGLMDEIQADESGMMEAEDDEFEADEEIIDGDDGEEEDMEVVGDMDDQDMDDMDDEDMGGNEELEDRVVDLEDKLDELMAEFEAIMNKEDDAEMDMADAEEDMADAEEDMVAEGLVPATKPHLADGTDGSAKHSTVAKNSGQAGMAGKPVAFGGGEEKGRTAPSVKEVEGAKGFKNAGGSKDGSKQSAAPKAKSEATKSHSPVPRG